MTHQDKSQPPKKIVRLDSLKQLNLNAAGLDIGATEIWACVPEDRAERTVRVFETFTTDLYALAEWLKQCGIETVAMESTGVYWIPIYEILEERGFETCLVNAHAAKNVSGRKTDVLDCQWIQQLHTYGLFQASFRPPADICTLRAYVRHRENLIRYRAAHVQHMQKALQLMNLQLPNVVKDITGLTGQQIIRAILAGERDPVQLAHFRDPRCKSSEADIAKALTGNYRPEHVFALKQAMELYDFYTQQLADCDAQIEKQYAVFQPQVVGLEPPQPRKKAKRHQKNHPAFDLHPQLYQLCGIDLTSVDGIDVVIAQDILAEIGRDMSKWPTVKHFTSWLRLCPQNDISGGKLLRSQTKKTKNRANTAFRMAAQAVSRSDSALGAFYRRIRAKHGAPKAITATAHKIARLVYFMLKERKPYQDPGQEYYEEQYRQRAIQNLQRKAHKLGLQVVPSVA